MAVVSLSLPIANAAALVGTYNRVVFYRSTGAGAPFVEISTPGTRPPLVADQVLYAFTDPNGAAGFLYSAGLINTATGATGPMGEPVPGGGDAALGIISIEDIKSRYLFGLPLTDRKGNALPDSFFSFYISAAVANLERILDIAITQQVIQDEPHAWYTPSNKCRPIVIYTFKAPVQSVQSITLSLPYYVRPQIVPQQWIRTQEDFGGIYLYPTTSLNVFAAPLISGGFNAASLGDNVPNAWRVSYVAGFERGKVPADILDALGMMAAISALGVMGSLVLPPGIGSTSFGIDGLSQSVSGSSGYADRTNAYLQALGSAIPSMKAAYRGSRLQGG